MTHKTLVGASLLAVFLASTAIPAFAEENQNTPKTAATVNVACIQSAVDKRDNAIIAAWDTFNASAKSALGTRRDALKAAWTLTDKKTRRDALKAAWDAFRKSSKDARKTFNDARKNAWKQFYADRKTCKANGEDVSSEGADSQL